MEDLIGYLYPDGTLVLEEDFKENMGDDHIVIFYSTTIGELMDYAEHTNTDEVTSYMTGR